MIQQKNTKNLIAETFKQVALKKSVEKITVKEIAKKSSITTQTFYNHFRDKYDLMAWIYSTEVEKIILKIDGEKFFWRDALSDTLEYLQANKNFMQNLIFNTGGQTSFINYMAQFNIKILSNYIKRSQQIETIPPDLEICIKFYCYGTVCIICEFLAKDFPANFVELLANALPEPLKKFLYS